MSRSFNETGVCIPEKHFMADISDRVERIIPMINNGDYFVINRPRQYGKTTLLYMLDRFLKNSETYFPIKISLEGMGSDCYKSEAAFIDAFMLQLKMLFRMSGNKKMLDFVETGLALDSIPKLGMWFTDLVIKAGKNVVLMIDEVDKSCNNQLFLDFLGMLRAKYLKRNEGNDITFQSVILAGVHDIKTLKSKIRAQEQDREKFNSPWNIAADFRVDLSLSTHDIASMLEQYRDETLIKLDIPYFSEKLFYFTSGYPFLVSLLCKIIDREILPLAGRKQWETNDLVHAVRLALLRDTTNFESLIKNLENNPDLYEFVFKIIMNGMDFSFNPRNAVIHLGRVYGILKEEGSKVRIHNRLYQQLIYDYMASNLETSGDIEHFNVASSYIRGKDELDIEKIIRKFQEFMKQQYSRRDTSFLERNGRLLFLAFIKPIINGKGFDFKEPQVSEEKRLDVVITFGSKHYIIELKIWRGQEYHQEGIKQLCGYLEGQNQDSGYLLIYDLRKQSGRGGDIERIESNGKKILAAWV